MNVRGKLIPRTDFILGVAGILTVVGLWWIVSNTGRVPRVLLPTPAMVWGGLEHFAGNDWLIPAVINTFTRILKALVYASLISIPMGVAMGAIPAWDAFWRKIVNGGASIPTTALFGVIIMAFGVQDKATIVFLVIGAVFFMTQMIRDAVLSVDEELVKLARDFDASPTQIIFKVLVPGALPQIVNAMIVGMGIQFTYIVLAEYISANLNNIGLGYLLQVSSKNMESGHAWASVILIFSIAATTIWGLQTLRRRYLPW